MNKTIRNLAIAALNAKLGKGKVFSTAEGVGKPAWAMNGRDGV